MTGSRRSPAFRRVPQLEIPVAGETCVIDDDTSKRRCQLPRQHRERPAADEDVPWIGGNAARRHSKPVRRRRLIRRTGRWPAADQILTVDWRLKQIVAELPIGTRDEQSIHRKLPRILVRDQLKPIRQDSPQQRRQGRSRQRRSARHRGGYVVSL